MDRDREKPFTPTRAIDALIGDEEQNGKKKEKKRNREQVPNPATLVLL